MTLAFGRTMIVSRSNKRRKPSQAIKKLRIIIVKLTQLYRNRCIRIYALGVLDSTLGKTGHVEQGSNHQFIDTYRLMATEL
ncbi:hypothetical protein COC46_10380 [Bacillus sp. AFS041924]|nr:hypothetical protein COC46_10380 [Bacillus sp. AFS041924]